MISLRYHVITIVAVFLALAIGLLAGSAFVEPELVDQLRGQTDRLRAEVRVRDDLLDEAREEATASGAFVEAAYGQLVRDRLLGAKVVLVTQEDAGDAVLGQAERALADGGADVVAVLTARSSLVSEDPETQSRLIEILGEPDALPTELASLAAAALAERLASGADALAPEEDLLNRLLSEGFLDTDGSEGTLEEIGLPGQIVVVLGGGATEAPALPPESFAMPLVLGLAGQGVPVAAAESAETPADTSLVGAVRDSGVDATVTVDDLDLSMGGAALVLGLDELLATGEGGAYGFKDGADPLPPLA